MASIISLPLEGRLNTVLQMVSFLESKHNGVAVFDPTEPEIDQNQFLTGCWFASLYGPCKKDTLSSAPVPRGTDFATRYFVDSGHAGDSVTRHLQTLFIVLLNIAHIFSDSKKQGSFETSSFLFGAHCNEILL